MGETLAFLNGVRSRGVGLVGAIEFYACTGAATIFAGSSFLDSANQIACPVLGLFGEADQDIPVRDVRVFGEQLYPGAPHGFFERQEVTDAEVSADAWKHVVDFITRYTPAS
jgi:carboxymethylenebutenolidase